MIARDFGLISTTVLAILGLLFVECNYIKRAKSTRHDALQLI